MISDNTYVDSIKRTNYVYMFINYVYMFIYYLCFINLV